MDFVISQELAGGVFVPPKVLNDRRLNLKTMSLLIHIINLQRNGRKNTIEVIEYLCKEFNQSAEAIKIVLMDLQKYGYIEEAHIEIAVTMHEQSQLKKQATGEAVSVETIGFYFDKLWKMYPKKESKQQAVKTFEHKLRGLSCEDAKNMANTIFVHLKKFLDKWKNEDTESRYIPHFSSWLNSEIPDSPLYKGRQKIK